MNQLYLVFFAIGILLFGGIALYSYMQMGGLKQRRQKGDDPLILDAKDDPVEPSSAAGELERSNPKLLNSESDDSQANENDGDADQNVVKASSRRANLSARVKEKLRRKVAPRLQSDTSLQADTSSDLGQNNDVAEVSEFSDDGADETGQKVVSNPQAANNNNKQNFQAASDTVNTEPQLDKKSSTLLTELVAKVKNPKPIEQQELLALFRNHDFKFHRKVNIYGLNELTDMWRDVEFELPSARFLELGISIQLADREGSMTQKELHDFQQMVLAYSNQFDAPFDFSMDLDEAFEQANLLDNIGRRYDSMAVLNVVPKSRTGFKMADIESCARDLMMSSDKNGIFMKTTGQKNNVSILYRLACTDGSGQFGVSSGSSASVHDLVVYMNVPATADPEIVFQDMVKDASSLATWLDGKVVDRNGRVMSQRSYSILMQQVSDIAFSMQQDGLKPGDATAKKLF